MPFNHHKIVTDVRNDCVNVYEHAIRTTQRLRTHVSNGPWKHKAQFFVVVPFVCFVSIDFCCCVYISGIGLSCSLSLSLPLYPVFLPQTQHRNFFAFNPDIFILFNSAPIQRIKLNKSSIADTKVNVRNSKSTELQHWSWSSYSCRSIAIQCIDHVRGAATSFNVRIYLYLSDDNGNLELQKVIRVARSYLTLFDYLFNKKKRWNVYFSRRK